MSFAVMFTLKDKDYIGDLSSVSGASASMWHLKVWEQWPEKEPGWYYWANIWHTELYGLKAGYDNPELESAMEQCIEILSKWDAKETESNSMWQFTLSYSYNGKRYDLQVMQIYAGDSLEKYQIKAKNSDVITVTTDRPLIETLKMKGELKTKKPIWKADRPPTNAEAYLEMLRRLKNAVEDFYNGRGPAGNPKYDQGDWAH